MAYSRAECRLLSHDNTSETIQLELSKAFAMMEAKIIVATVAQHVDLKLAAGQKVEPEPLITLRPRYGMKMNVHSRGRSIATRS